MKKLLVVGLCLVLAACGDSTSLERPDNVYEVDGWGSNPDIIEFTPVGRGDMTCLIVVTGGDQAAGIDCFKKLVDTSE